MKPVGALYYADMMMVPSPCQTVDILRGEFRYTVHSTSLRVAVSNVSVLEIIVTLQVP